MKIAQMKEGFVGVQWYWDEEAEGVMLDEKKVIHVVLRSPDFVENLTVVSGYQNVEDVMGKLFFSREYFQAGSPPYFLILKTGRIWFLNASSSMEKDEIAGLVRKIAMNPEVINVFDKVSQVRTAADLVLS